MMKMATNDTPRSGSVDELKGAWAVTVITTAVADTRNRAN